LPLLDVWSMAPSSARTGNTWRAQILRPGAAGHKRLPLFFLIRRTTSGPVIATSLATLGSRRLLTKRQRGRQPAFPVSLCNFFNHLPFSFLTIASTFLRLYPTTLLLLSL